MEGVMYKMEDTKCRVLREAQESAREMPENWPRILEEIDDYDEFVGVITSDVILDKSSECVGSFINWCNYEGMIDLTHFEWDIKSFISVYLIRYHENDFFEEIEQCRGQRLEIIELARTLSEQFDRMIRVLRSDDRSSELHISGKSLADQILILSKPLISFRFKNSVRSFVVDLLRFRNMINLKCHIDFRYER